MVQADVTAAMNKKGTMVPTPIAKRDSTRGFTQRPTYISATVRSRPFTFSLAKALGDATGSRLIELSRITGHVDLDEEGAVMLSRPG